jgi:hypothetical protein
LLGCKDISEVRADLILARGAPMFD